LQKKIAVNETKKGDEATILAIQMKTKLKKGKTKLTCEVSMSNMQVRLCK
jgi:hypothetical protein